MRVNDAVHGGRIYFDVVRIERLPIPFQDPSESIPVSTRDKLFRQCRHSLFHWNRASIPQSLRERAGEPAHFVPAFFTFLDAHGYAHELVRPPEIPVRFLDIHHIGDHSTATAGD